jgi:hypothetical protein
MKRARIPDQRESRVIQIPRPENTLLEGHERTILAYLMSGREACTK